MKKLKNRSEKDKQELNLILSVLKKYLPKWTQVFVFGSKATWEDRPNSDWDIWIIWENVDFETILKIKSELEELPVLVDIVDFNKVDKKFKDYVFNQWVVMLEKI